MADRACDPRALDITALCRDGGTLQGTWPLAGMPRLAGGLNGMPGATTDGTTDAMTDGTTTWSAQGSSQPAAGGQPQLWLHLQASAAVSLQCQRCLQPMTELLAVDRRLRFVHGEAQAAQLDEDSDDDVLALPRRLDLHALLEDELILALPLVPRHPVCPQPLLPAGAGDGGADGEQDEAANPFAALAALRGGPPH